MTSTEYDTEQLRQLAQALRGNQLDATVTQKVAELEIPFLDWPLLSAASAAMYENLRKATENASKKLAGIVETLATSVDRVAETYDQQQEEYGADLSKAGDQIGQVTSSGETQANRGAQGGQR